MTEDLVNVERIDVSTNPAGGCIEIWTLNRPNRLNALNDYSQRIDTSM